MSVILTGDVRVLSCCWFFYYPRLVLLCRYFVYETWTA